MKEYQKTVVYLDTKKSALAEHHAKTGHDISWDDYKLLRTCDKWKQRKIMEAWEINLEPNPWTKKTVQICPSNTSVLLFKRNKEIYI